MGDQLLATINTTFHGHLRNLWPLFTPKIKTNYPKHFRYSFDIAALVYTVIMQVNHTYWLLYLQPKFESLVKHARTVYQEYWWQRNWYEIPYTQCIVLKWKHFIGDEIPTKTLKKDPLIIPSQDIERAALDPTSDFGWEGLQSKIWKVKKLKLNNFRHNSWSQGGGGGVTAVKNL